MLQISAFPKQPDPTFGRLAGRPTLFTDRPGRSTGPNRELGTFSRLTGRSTALLLRSTGPVDRYSCACCCARSCTTVDRAVDRSAASADGRPDRSTMRLLAAISAAAELLNFWIWAELPRLPPSSYSLWVCSSMGTSLNFMRCKIRE